jgi:hypothetical protein
VSVYSSYSKADVCYAGHSLALMNGPFMKRLIPTALTELDTISFASVSKLKPPGPLQFIRDVCFADHDTVGVRIPH